MSASSAPVVLVTGCAGFTGRHMIAHIRAAEPRARVVGVDLSAADGPSRPDVFLRLNLAEGGAAASVIADHRPELLIHLAGRMPPAMNDEMWAGNVGVALNLLEALVGTGHGARFLAVGSAAEYGSTPARPVDEAADCHPAHAYGRSKLAQTILCRHYAQRGVPAMVVRPFNLFGPGMPARTLVGEVCRQLAKPTAPVRVGDLSALRDFLDIRDAVADYWTVARRGVAGEVYNVCSGTPTRVDWIVCTLAALAGGAAIVPHATLPRADNVDYSCGDPSKLARLGGAPRRRELTDALRQTLESFQRGADPSALSQR